MFGVCAHALLSLFLTNSFLYSMQGPAPEVKAIPMVMSRSQEQRDSHPVLKCIGYNHNHAIG